MKRAIYNILFVFQILFILAALSLQYFSNKKMGVARFLIFYKSEFQKIIFNPNSLKLYIIISLVLFMSFLMLTILKLKSKGAILLSLNLLLLIFLIYEPFLNLKAGYFIVIALVLAELIEIIKVIIQIQL